MQVIKIYKPKFVMASPPCTMFSQMQRTNVGRVDPDTLRDRMLEGHMLLSVGIDVCRAQHTSKRKFALEHPSYASSWNSTAMQDAIVTNMCVAM